MSPIVRPVAVNPIALSQRLQSAIERARKSAESSGAFQLRGRERGRNDISPTLSEAIVDLLRDGSYAAAVARVAAEDPDLADQ